MVKLTPNEQSIIQIMLILLNPMLKEQPFDSKRQFIREIFRIKQISINEKEMEELVYAITEEGKFTATQLFKFIIKMKIDPSKMFDPEAFRLGF